MPQRRASSCSSPAWRPGAWPCACRSTRVARAAGRLRPRRVRHGRGRCRARRHGAAPRAVRDLELIFVTGTVLPVRVPEASGLLAMLVSMRYLRRELIGVKVGRVQTLLHATTTWWGRAMHNCYQDSSRIQICTQLI
jgi:hypothetical protein